MEARVHSGERMTVSRFIAAPLAVLALVCCCALGPAKAAWAQVPTVQFQESYQAYNVWQYGSNKCTKPQTIYGSEPAAPGTYPVLIYLHGTLADWGGNVEGQRVAQLAAGEGFVAAAFTYSSAWTGSPSGTAGNANCMFNPAAPGNGISQVCAMAEADCSNGFVVAGFSQGGAIAALAKNVNPQVQGAWLMGVSGPDSPSAVAAPAGTRMLPNNRLRIDVGQRDIQSTNPTTGQVTFSFSNLNALTGQSCSTFSCLAPDGSGYYVVQNSEVADGVADHCYWMRVNMFAPTNSCTWNPTFDPGFVPPSTTPWSLITSLNWLRTMLGNAPAS